MGSRTLTLAIILIASGALFAACTSSSNPGTPGGPPPINTSTTATDPGPEPTGGPTQWDIASVTTSRTGIGSTYTQITVTVTYDQGNAFSSLVPAGTTGSSNTQLGTFIYFNADSNPATGQSVTFGGCGPWDGMDFAVADGSVLYGGRLADGNFPIVNTSLVQVGEASVSGSGSTISYGIPLSAIGGSSGQMAVTAENFPGGVASATDCLPDSSTEIVTSQVRSPLSLR
jgi:hypothetical protein